MLLQGVLHLSKRSSNEGTVQVGSRSASLLRTVAVKGKAALNRAMQGDTVAGRQPCCACDKPIGKTALNRAMRGGTIAGAQAVLRPTFLSAIAGV